MPVFTQFYCFLKNLRTREFAHVGISARRLASIKTTLLLSFVMIDMSGNLYTFEQESGEITQNRIFSWAEKKLYPYWSLSCHSHVKLAHQI